MKQVKEGIAKASGRGQPTRQPIDNRGLFDPCGFEA